MINILILAVDRVQSDNNDGPSYPSCLAESNGVALIEKIVKSLIDLDKPSYTFALHGNDVAQFHLDNICRLLVPDAKIGVVPENTMGSGCTALLSACNLEPNAPILILSANELVQTKLGPIIKSFAERNLDAGTLVFHSVHPRYSYVSLDENGLVKEAAQKNPISQLATVGLFWFKHTSDFIEAAKNQIRKNSSTDDKFYLAPCFNELILKGKKIGVYEINKDSYIPLKTPQQIKQYEMGLK